MLVKSGHIMQPCLVTLYKKFGLLIQKTYSAGTLNSFSVILFFKISWEMFFFLKGPDIKVLFSNSAFDLKCYVMCGKGPIMNHMDMAGGGSFLKSILHLKAYLIKCSTKG